MNSKILPFTKSQIEKIIKKYPTPFHIYDEKAIRENARAFYKAFDWVEGGSPAGRHGFKNYFAIKATPNPYIMKILKEEGMGVDCSSYTELLLAEKVGFKGEEMVFPSNDTAAKEFQLAKKLGAIIILDDISDIPFLEKAAGIPDIIAFRYNPGLLRKHKGNFIIGHPEDQKYGLTHDQMLEAYGIMKKKGVERFGFHSMFASNERDPNAFIETADILFDLAVEINRKLNIRFEFIDLSGGIGVPYKPEEDPVDLKKISQGIKKLYEQKITGNKLNPIRIVMECGRMLTGPYGHLVTTVLHKKNIYKQYVGLDASMANLMRPAMYGAYHHITIMGKENNPLDHIYDVTGSLCENNDKFAINRKLPQVEIGDILVIHDTGAHGHAMGFNYNGKLRSAELLLKPDGNVELIRRAETPEDYFATLDFKNL